MLLSQSSFDDRPYKITKLLIGSFIGAFIFVMVFNQNLFKDIASLWEAWIGAAIGYFFGSRPVDKLIEKIEDITKLAEQYLRPRYNKKFFTVSTATIHSSSKYYKSSIYYLSKSIKSSRKNWNCI